MASRKVVALVDMLRFVLEYNRLGVLDGPKEERERL